jgi:hypothetical protein
MRKPITGYVKRNLKTKQSPGCCADSVPVDTNGPFFLGPPGFSAITGDDMCAGYN